MEFDEHRRRSQIEETLRRLVVGPPTAPQPAPEAFGWSASVTDDDGRPIRWYHPPTGALIGFVPGHPELVFLDDRHEIRAWEMSIGELVAAIEAGTLPDADVLLDWQGAPV